MNDDLFYNKFDNDSNNNSNMNETTIPEDTADATVLPENEPVEASAETSPVSAPYRYKYAHGEKTEIPGAASSTESSSANNPYHTYYYNTASSYYGAETRDNSQETVSGAAQTAAEPEKPKKKHKFLRAMKWVAGAACFGVIASAAFIGGTYLATEVFGIDFIQISSDNAPGTDGTISGTLAGNGVPLNITLGTTSTIEGVENPAESVVVQVVDQNMAATVAVKSTFMKTYSYWGQQYQQESQGSGSGFIVGMNDTELLIATNNHVIDSATKIEITFIDDTVLEASIKGTDSLADLAIIAVPLENISAETLSKIRVATLGNSEDVRLGEMAIAIGNALGYGQSVTVGYISAKDRTVTVDGNEMVLLQTDAAINGGNSGGPLFNTRGEVIGINSVKYADTNVEGMCFAIPISRAIPILNELMTREILAEEDKGFLGVSTRSVTDEIASFYGWPIGAYIVTVLEGSPAEEANLYVGDIVTSINGVQIVTADQLVSAVSSYRHGTTIEMKVQRNVNGKYEEITLNVTLAKKADVEAANETAGTTAPDAEAPQEESGNSQGSKRPGTNPER
ncbi:MAG: trypsin-like peptidase domain-containing protein [Lachnospiraceae bacterium]|nr:trypsin-like peptidase domain-containing protein [Lachnospiraceae bacterium]